MAKKLMTQEEEVAELEKRLSAADAVVGKYSVKGKDQLDSFNQAIEVIFNSDYEDDLPLSKAKEIRTLILGRDSFIYGTSSFGFQRPSATEIQWGCDSGWEKDEVLAGYAVFSDGVNGACVIDRIDDMDTFDGWEEAEKMAEIDGHKFIPLKELKIPRSAVSDDFYSSRGGVGIDGKIHRYRYLDTPENRELLKEYLVPVRNRKAKEPDICR